MKALQEIIRALSGPAFSIGRGPIELTDAELELVTGAALPEADSSVGWSFGLEFGGGEIKAFRQGNGL